MRVSGTVVCVVCVMALVSVERNSGFAQLIGEGAGRMCIRGIKYSRRLQNGINSVLY